MSAPSRSPSAGGWLAAFGVLLLAACTSAPRPLAAPAAPPVPGTALLQQVRSAGRLGVELDVQPLRDPQVADLRARATQAVARGDYAAAEADIRQALALTPADPDLLQWQAELALVRRDFATAGQAAQRSFDTGPKVGGLCRRNWTTLQLAAEARGDAAATAAARTQAASCKVAPPVRM
jgi:tetratricopeptide (TPR) repeat protein